jgi:hypothetical protein
MLRIGFFRGDGTLQKTDSEVDFNSACTPGDFRQAVDSVYLFFVLQGFCWSGRLIPSTQYILGSHGAKDSTMS